MSDASKAVSDAMAQQAAGGGVKREEPLKIKVVVSGEEREVTQEELVKRFELAEASYQRMREAADLRKAAEPMVRAKQLVAEINSGAVPDVDKLERVAELGRLMGLPQDSIDANVAQLRAAIDATTEEQKNKPGAGGSAADGEKKPVKYEDLDPALRQELQASRDARVAETRQRMLSDIKIALDTDADLGMMRLGADEDVYRSVCNEVQRRIVVANEPYGPELVRNAVSAMKALLGKVGKPAGSTEQDGTTYPSLGPASGSIAPLLQARKPVERKAATADDYSENLTQRLFVAAARLGM